MPEKAKPRTRRRAKKLIPRGKVFIQSTFNNTIITFTNPEGDVVAWASSGSSGFKGSRKGTPFAAQIAAQDAVKKAMDHGMRQVEIFVRGPGSGREAALRALKGTGSNISSIRDITPMPHNGCRPPKRRRV